MRRTVIIVLGIFMSYFLMAQEPVKQKEVGLVFSDLNNFGLSYKTGTNKSLWRFNTLLIRGSSMDNTSDSLVQKQSNQGFAVKLGKEYRKDLDDKLELRFGADVSFTYNQSSYDYDDKSISDNDRMQERTTYQPGVNLVFGLNYKFTDNLILGAELLPGFYYTTGTLVEKAYYTNNGEELKGDISGFSYGLSNGSALLSLSYRF